MGGPVVDQVWSGRGEGRGAVKGSGSSNGVGRKGAEGWGGQNFALFFSRLAPSNLLFFVSHWVSSR